MSSDQYSRGPVKYVHGFSDNFLRRLRETIHRWDLTDELALDRVNFGEEEAVAFYRKKADFYEKCAKSAEKRRVILESGSEKDA